MKMSLDLNFNTQRAADGRVLDLQRVKEAAGHCDFFHGSRSASLLTFTTDDSSKRGHLLPAGKLLDSGITPLSGEGNYDPDVHQAPASGARRRHINESHLSASSLGGIVDSFDYAVKYGDSNPQRLARNGSPDDPRRAYHQSLKPADRELVNANFAVLYGLRTDTDQQPGRLISDRHSSNSVGIRGGVAPNEIAIILTEDDRVDLVRGLVRRQPETAHIEVAGFSSILKAETGGVASPAGRDPPP